MMMEGLDLSANSELVSHDDNSHQMLVPVNREREAAWHVVACCFATLSLERAASQHCLLRSIKSNLSELAPIHDKTVLSNDVVDGKLTLSNVSTQTRSLSVIYISPLLAVLPEH